MDNFLEMHIFFFVTTVAVVVVTVLVLVILASIARSLRNIEEITNSLKNAIHSAESGLAEVGEMVVESPLFSFIFGKKKHYKSKKKDD